MSSTKRITRLTAEGEEARFQEFVTKWAAIGRSTQPADRDRAEWAICRLYELANLPEPRVIWLPCPLSGALSALVYGTLVAKKVLPPLPTQIPEISAVHSTVRRLFDSAVRSARYRNVATWAVGLMHRPMIDLAVGSGVRPVRSLNAGGLALISAVRSVVRSQRHSNLIYSGVGSAITSALLSAVEWVDPVVRLAVESALMSAVGSAVRSQRYSNLIYSGVGSAIESAMLSAVDLVDPVVRSAVESALIPAVDSSAVRSARSARRSILDPVVSPAFLSNPVEEINSVVEWALISAVRSSRYSDVVGSAVCSAVGSRFGGSRWLGYAAWADYCNQVLSISLDRSYLELLESCGYVWTLDGICFASERPSRLNFDNRGRLHSETGQSIGYRSGWGLWHWHGVQVPRFIIEQPETITVKRIQKEVNVEVRRIMMERYGQARYLIDSSAKLIHADEMGELYFTAIRGDEPLVMVKVMNSTLEPDGSRKPYFLRVHPECRLLLANGELGERQPMTARAAIASTFGMTADEYAGHLIAQT